MISSQVEKVPVVCSVSVVGEVGERTLASTGGLVTSPVVFSSVDTSLTTSSPPENYKNEDNIRSVAAGHQERRAVLLPSSLRFLESMIRLYSASSSAEMLSNGFFAYGDLNTVA